MVSWEWGKDSKEMVKTIRIKNRKDPISLGKTSDVITAYGDFSPYSTSVLKKSLNKHGAEEADI